MENPTCPMCDGPGVLLGTLGSLDWFRCRNCGFEFNQDSQADVDLDEVTSDEYSEGYSEGWDA